MTELVVANPDVELVALRQVLLPDRHPVGHPEQRKPKQFKPSNITVRLTLHRVCNHLNILLTTEVHDNCVPELVPEPTAQHLPLGCLDLCLQPDAVGEPVAHPDFQRQGLVACRRSQSAMATMIGTDYKCKTTCLVGVRNKKE